MESLRTTIVLEKELYRQAKRLALEQDTTLKEVVERALRAYLRGDQQGAQKSKGGTLWSLSGESPWQLKAREHLSRLT